MLIITRRITEVFSIIIDGKIIAKVRMMEINGNQTRIGFIARKRVKLLRDELLEREELRDIFVDDTVEP